MSRTQKVNAGMAVLSTYLCGVATGQTRWWYVVAFFAIAVFNALCATWRSAR